jgi:hypothetical protein
MLDKKFILSLIKDDLINAKLVLGLKALGLHPDDYCLYLSGKVFSLMGFKESAQTDQIYEKYLELTEKVKEIDIALSMNQLEELALQIYTELLTANMA